MCIAVHVPSTAVWGWPTNRGLIGCFVLELQCVLIHAFVVNQPQQNICRDVTDNTQQLLWLLELQCSTGFLSFFFRSELQGVIVQKCCSWSVNTDGALMGRLLRGDWQPPNNMTLWLLQLQCAIVHLFRS